MGVFLKKEPSGSVIIGLWEITEDIDVLYSQIILNDEERALYNNFKNDLRKMHWLGYRNLLKELLSPGEYFHVNYDKYGKPFLALCSHHLSVAHSGKFAAAIVSKNKPVGIDIEQIKPKIEKLASKFLSEKELVQIGCENKMEQLYVYWGAKEALYKLYGKGKLLFPENILILPFRYADEGEMKGIIHTDEFHREYWLNYQKIQDYMLVYTAG